MDTRYHKLVSLTGMVSGIFDSGIRLAIRDDQGRDFPYPSHLNRRPPLNTPSPQHLSLPILGLISPPQSNRCCCLETRALREHGKQDKLCADNLSICFTKFRRIPQKIVCQPTILMLIISVLFNDQCHLILSIQCYPTINLNFMAHV